MSLVIVGLGNPGRQYQGTRHNLGARVVEIWSKTHPEAHILLPKKYFMNDSGQAIAGHGDLLIVHDDVELPLGKWQLTPGGGAKGHKGVRSIHQVVGTTTIPRLRIGIGRPQSGELKDFVLAKFTPAEQEVLRAMMPQLVQAVTSYCLASAPKITNT